MPRSRRTIFIGRALGVGMQRHVLSKLRVIPSLKTRHLDRMVERQARELGRYNSPGSGCFPPPFISLLSLRPISRAEIR
jgi:hypothetical protein